MCGIYVSNIKQSKEEVRQKLNSIQFRGPDFMGVEQIDDIIMGHLRLAILDLDSRSNQPFVYDDLMIVYNGEIYNFETIRVELEYFGYTFETSSDTEVLIKGFHKWGVEVFDKLNGMFAFAIFNRISKKLYICRDRLGVKPIYFYWKDGDFEICSQLRPISEGKKVDPRSVSMFLECGYIPSPYSIFQFVSKLSPGKFIEIDTVRKKYQEIAYWDLKPQKILDIDYETAKDRLHELLIDAVKIRLKSDVPFGSFLSGGIDSALVSSIAAKYGDQILNTFSIGFENKEYDESKIASEYSKIIKSNHTETICKSADIMELIDKLVEVYDEPFADSSALPSLLLNKVTKQYVTVALSGDGGDESFLGYNHFVFINKANSFYRLHTYIRKSLRFVFSAFLKGKAFDRLKKLTQLGGIEDFVVRIFVGFNTLLENRNLDWLAQYTKYLYMADHPIQKAADLNIKLWLENDSNVKVDRASMAFSVEVRSPFLDYRIVEFARSLPIEYRYDIKGNIRKKILRDILKDYIPESVFDQPKRGFAIPLEDWIRKDLKKDFECSLDDEFLKLIPNFNTVKFKKIFKDHLDGHKNHTTFIWRVFVLSRWYKEFGLLA